MDQGSFPLEEQRKSLRPWLSMLEVSRRMNMAPTFLFHLEKGHSPWPPGRKEQYDAIIANWKTQPDPRPRKKRKDAGKKHRGYKLTKPRKPRVLARAAQVPDECLTTG